MDVRLFAAWHVFRKSKKPTHTIDAFAYDLEPNLHQLACDIDDRRYRHGNYQHVVITEKKRRDLSVAPVRDRIVHRLVYDELIPLFDHIFDDDVWSCRLGKGLHGCLHRTQEILQKYPNAYVWRMDITKFFDHVDHKVLTECLQRRISDEQLQWLCDQIVDSWHKTHGQGIPIGNLTSQIFANIYLNEFDRYVRRTLKPLAYVRYGDDMILFCDTRREAHNVRQQATEFLHCTLNLDIHATNNVIVAADAGLHFLGDTLSLAVIMWLIDIPLGDH